MPRKKMLGWLELKFCKRNSRNDSGNDGIYGTMDNNEDKNFSYHSSDGSVEEEENDQQVLGQNAVGTLPLATNCNNGPEYSLLNWQYKIKHIKPYGKAELSATLTSQIFPCIACNNHKNISDPSTWVLVFLLKAGIDTWGLFD
jgi:hypothetical protein